MGMFTQTAARRTPKIQRVLAPLYGLYTLGLCGFLLLRTLLGDRPPKLALLADFTPLYFAPLIVLFPLAVITQARAALLLLIPPALTGGWMIGRLYLPKQIEPPSVRAIHVRTFNVLYSNPMLDQALEHAAQNTDLLFLQELPATYTGGIDFLRDPFPYQRFDGSNGLLSRYPFDGSMGGIHPAVVLIENTPVVVYAVHAPLPINGGFMANGIVGLAGFYNPAPRDATLMPLMQALEGETRPFIVAGDFNMTEYSTLYPRLAAVMTDSYREAGIGLGLTWSLRLPTPLVRIDYIWHSEHFRAVSATRDLTWRGSDHAPLSVVLDWR